MLVLITLILHLFIFLRNVSKNIRLRQEISLYFGAIYEKMSRLRQSIISIYALFNEKNGWVNTDEKYNWRREMYILHPLFDCVVFLF